MAMFCAGAFVIGVVGQEFWRGVRARRAVSSESVPVALMALVRRNRRRYGGYIVHLGMAIIFVGVAASSTFQRVHDVSLSPGQSARDTRSRVPRFPPRPVSQRTTSSQGVLSAIRLNRRYVSAPS